MRTTLYAATHRLPLPATRFLEGLVGTPALLATYAASWSFSKLVEKAEGIRKLGIASSLRPDFLAQTAEYFRQDGAV